MSTTADIETNIACVHCGADLQGTSREGRCPACRQPVDGMWYLAPVDDTSGTLAADVPCVGCEYNLRTLSVSGLCPECGRPVIDSLSRKRLCFMDAQALEEVRRGSFIVLMMLLTPLGCILAALMEFQAMATISFVLATFSIIFGLPTGLALMFDAKMISPHPGGIRTGFRTGLIVLFVLVTLFIGGVFSSLGVWVAGMLLAMAMFVGRRVARLMNSAGVGRLKQIANVWSATLSLWAASVWVRFLLICFLGDFGRELAALGFPVIDLALLLVCYGLSVIVFGGLWRMTKHAARLQEALGVDEEAKPG